MRQKILLTWLLGWLMVMPMATMAQEPQEQDASSLQNVVAIYPVQGERVLFSFASNPELSYTATELVITTAGTSVQYPINQLMSVKFEKAETAEGILSLIDEIEVPEHFLFRDGQIVIEHGTPGSKVNIYNVQGMLVSQYSLDGEGNAAISTQGMTGVYIVTNERFTFKFAQQ